jgi:hypothetical protein
MSSFTCTKKQPAPPPPKAKIMFSMDWFWNRLEQDIKNAKGFTVDPRGCFAFEQKTEDREVRWIAYDVYNFQKAAQTDTTFGIWNICDSKYWTKYDIEDNGEYCAHTPFSGSLFPIFGFANIKWRLEDGNRLTVTVTANETVESRVFYLFDLKKVSWKDEWSIDY